MLASRKTKRGVIGAAVLAGVLAVGGYALTNTITFADDNSAAGFGGVNVQTQNVTDIDYSVSATDPTVIEDDVTFTVTAIESVGNDAVAYAKLRDGGTWVACDAITEADVSVVCDFTGYEVAEIGETPAGVDDGNVSLVIVE